MQSLDSYLMGLRKAKMSYDSALGLATQFALSNGGTVVPADETGTTIIKAFGEEAHCFQPYPDIDVFYFET